jgi:cytochrome b subunit of formate dehydrogenase
LAKFLRFLIGWVLGAVTTTAVGVALQTQNVIARLNDIGANIGVGQRLSMTVYDLAYLGSLYIFFVALGTLVAYLAGLLVYRIAGFGRPIVFAVAGAVAILVMLMLMKQAFFGIHLIAGARDGVGIGLQMGAGAIGGLVFAVLTARLAARSQKLT